jgi:hypothetical protein
MGIFYKRLQKHSSSSLEAGFLAGATAVSLHDRGLKWL